jgi:hypothetical protein
VAELLTVVSKVRQRIVDLVTNGFAIEASHRFFMLVTLPFSLSERPSKSLLWGTGYRGNHSIGERKPPCLHHGGGVSPCGSFITRPPEGALGEREAEPSAVLRLMTSSNHRC